MDWKPFKLELFFAKHEFSARYHLCASDAESVSMHDLLALADEETKALWDNLRLGYTESAGLPLLRKEINKLHPKAPFAGVGVFAGAEEAIFAFMCAHLKPGDHVIVPKPCYQSLYAIPTALGAEVSFVPLREAAGGWRFFIEDLEAAIKPNTRLIVINFPHNPTGLHINKATLDDIITIARKQNALLFSDEVYRFSEHNEEATLPAASDLYENAVSLGVVSKSLGLAGLRIGWLVSQDEELIQKTLSFKNYLTICNSAPSEVLALIALRAKEKLLQRNLGLIRSNLSLLDRFFQKHHRLFAWKRPTAGTTAFVKLLSPTPVHEFCDDLLMRQEVLLLPGNLFDFPGNFFRIGFGRKDMPDALARFEKYLSYKLQDD